MKNNISNIKIKFVSQNLKSRIPEISLSIHFHWSNTKQIKPRGLQKESSFFPIDYLWKKLD